MAGDVPQLKDEFSSRALFGFNFNFNPVGVGYRLGLCHKAHKAHASLCQAIKCRSKCWMQAYT